MNKLTTNSFPRVIDGVDVYFRGEQFRVAKKFKTTVHLQSLETVEKKIRIVTIAEVKKYTRELNKAGRSFASDMTSHKREVMCRRYTSVYFPPAPRTVYDNF